MPNTIESWVLEHFQALPSSRLPNFPGLGTIRKNKGAQVYAVNIPLSTGQGTGLFFTPHPDAGDKKTLILFLGSLGSSSDALMTSWIQTYLDHGHHCLVLPWDGHGNHSGTLLDLQSATSVLPILGQRLSKDKSPDWNPKVFIVGFSLGATFSLISASHPQVKSLLDAIVAVSPVFRLQGGLRRKTSCKSLNIFRAAFDLYPLFFQGAWRAWKNRTKGYDKIRWRCAVDKEAQISHFCEEFFKNRNTLTKVELPVLWIHGEKDRLTTVRKAGDMLQSLGKNLTKHIDPHRNHYLTACARKNQQVAVQYLNHLSEEMEISHAHSRH